MDPRRSDADDPGAVREAALKLLSRRDHSDRELTQKLMQRGFATAQVEQVLSELTDQGLHSEQRFAQSYARMRANKYYGPLRIRAELAERGVDRNTISQALDALEHDFSASACAFYQRKYRTPAGDYREKARRSQAMARRGFTGEQLRGVLD